MQRKTTRQILIEARALIADPKHWIKGEFARTSKRGEAVRVTDPDATCFCAIGALKRVANGNWPMPAINALESCLPGTGTIIEDFNDKRTTKHSDVLAVFDCAIKKANDDLRRV